MAAAHSARSTDSDTAAPVLAPLPAVPAGPARIPPQTAKFSRSSSLVFLVKHPHQYPRLDIHRPGTSAWPLDSPWHWTVSVPNSNRPRPNMRIPPFDGGRGSPQDAILRQIEDVCPGAFLRV